MILTGDYHTHTPYSHGKGTVFENATRAKEIGLKQIAITDHGFSHMLFGLKRSDMKSIKAEVKAAREEVGMDVLLGMESNLRGIDGGVDITEKYYDDFDIFLCGIHVMIWYSTITSPKIGIGSSVLSGLNMRPSKTLIRDTTKAYINAIKKHPIDVITHLNFQCFADAVEVAKCARDYGTFIELNSKKIHLTDEEIARVRDTGVNFIIDSDAHSVARVGDTKLVDGILSRVEIPESQIVNINGKIPDFRFARFKEGR